MKLFYLESLGCAKNQVDSESLISFLETRGFSLTNESAQAEFIIVNTCGFIESAKQESIETVLSLQQTYPGKKILMTGCLAMRYGPQLAKDLPEIDVVPEKIGTSLFFKRFGALVEVDVGSQVSLTRNPGHLLSFPGSAYVRLADGCDNNCTYCAIPLIRGPLTSRQRHEIVAEVRNLVAKGIREINLIAQDTALFGNDRGAPELVTLLRELDTISGDFWIRLLYLHPDHLTRDIIETVFSSKRFAPYFDIPFQHASKPILQAMNRRGSAETYEHLVASIRSFDPRAAVRTTFLVGFPGETAEDFDRLVSFHESIKPTWSGVFTYSREEGTKAWSLRQRVPQKTAESRMKTLRERQTTMTEIWLEQWIGRETDVLLEEFVEGENLSLGRTLFQAPDVDGLVVVENAQAVPGSVVRVRIEKRSGIDLKGVRIND